MAPPADFSAWYAGHAVVTLLVMLAIVGYGFATSVSGRALFREGLVPE